MNSPFRFTETDMEAIAGATAELVGWFLAGAGGVTALWVLAVLLERAT